MSESHDTPDPGIEVRTYFVREHNALVARADFSELYASLYLHQMDCGLRLNEACDQILRDALAAMTLHCASRPRGDTAAWTVNIQSPLANVFVGGDNHTGTVIGNLLTDNVKQGEKNLFYADSVEEGKTPRRSVIGFTGADFLKATEEFYAQSEQRPARFFRHEEEDIVMISAQPDCNLAWLEALDQAAVQRLDQDVTLSLLEQRHYRLECGCNQERMLNMLAPVMRRQPDELFEDEEVVRVHCPRCGARHTVTREALEAHLAATDKA